MHHWVVSAARWWGKLRDRMPDEGENSSRLAYNVWVDDVKLALAGCVDCWTYKLLHTLQVLGVVEASQWCAAGVTAEQVQELEFKAEDIASALARILTERWAAVVNQGAYANPRDAPSENILLCTHGRWVYPPGDTLVRPTRHNSPEYMQLCLPFKMLQCIARLRMGCAMLEVHAGRMARPMVVRQCRLCKMCSCPASRQIWKDRVYARTHSHANVEDLKHFLLECPAYDHIRARHRGMFRPPGVTNALCDSIIPHIFTVEPQEEMAVTLYQMWLFRLVTLGLVNVDEVHVPQPPEDSIPEDYILAAVLP
jgi:hypothetical protein